MLKSELNRERFGELAQEMPIYAQYPNEKQETYIKTWSGAPLPTVRSWMTTSAVMRWAGPLSGSPAWRRPSCADGYV